MTESYKYITVKYNNLFLVPNVATKFFSGRTSPQERSHTRNSHKKTHKTDAIEMKATNQKNLQYSIQNFDYRQCTHSKFHWPNSSVKKVPSKLFLRKKEKITN